MFCWSVEKRESMEDGLLSIFHLELFNSFSGTDIFLDT